MIDDLLARRTEASRCDAFRPVPFVLPADMARLEELLARHPDALVHDEIVGQVRGLLETRDPAGTLDDLALERRVAGHLGAHPSHHGAWMWFPWARRLVHVLPEDEYRELRTSRNRNKITEAEQDVLRGLHIGIVGLSIGQAAAVTLTLEEVGGLLVLADFDWLELSNMNRLRVGVQGLGVNKAILAAREVFEINPWARVEVLLDGVHADNIDTFFHTGGRRLDLVYEECDDLGTKVLVRQHARRLGVPVLMETSDRGLMDIERFDLEPDRPIFHGLVGDLDAAALKGMTTHEKVPLVMRIIGRDGMSDRMAASMIDVEASLKSWPQLASEVALGAGLNVDTARRIALGQLAASGRFYVDMHQIIDDARARPVQAAPPAEILVSDEAHHFDLPPLRERGETSVEAIRTLVAWATTAFSGGNCQPWAFVWDGATLTLQHDVARSESLLDVHHRASHLAFGSVLETIDMVAPALGLAPATTLFPTDDPLHVADIRLDRALGRPLDPLLEAIPDRVTNRQLGDRVPLDPGLRDALSAEAARRGGRVQWLERREDLDAIADVIARGDRLRMLSRQLHEEMMHEVRWTLEDVERTRDGLDVATLEMSAADLAGLKVVRRWSVMRMVGAVGGGLGLERPSRKAVRAASAVGLLTVQGTAPEDFVRAGRALHRLWLLANKRGLAFQPMTSLAYLWHRLRHAGGEGLTETDIAGLTALRGPFEALFETSLERAEAMVFRLARAPAPTARSLRRRVEDVLILRGEEPGRR